MAINRVSVLSTDGRYDKPLFQSLFMRSLRFVVGEFDFIFGGLFVMSITGVTSFEGFYVTDKDEFTARRDMVDFSGDFDFFWVQGEFLVESDLVEGLVCGAECLIYLWRQMLESRRSETL